MADYKLSLSSAIVININTMLGTGIFLNSITLAAFAGGLCPLSYALVGLLTVPLVIAFAVLLDYHKTEESDFYSIIKSELGVLAGFSGTWIFFITRAVVLGLLIHFDMYVLSEIFSVLKQVPLMVLDFIFLALLVLVNLFNMRIGSGIQKMFTVVKISAVSIIVALGLWYFKGANFALPHLNFGGLPATIPVVLFAYLGFDTTVSLSKHIENPKRNGPIALLVSYLVVITVYCLYQLCYYSALDLNILAANASNPLNVIVVFIQSTIQSAFLQNILHVCVCLSAFSAIYGVMFGNIWNLHALTGEKLFIGGQTLAQKNKSGIAHWCLLAEAAICAVTILINANIVTAQLICSLGSSVVYFFSMAAFYRVASHKTHVMWHKIVALCAFGSCGVYLFTCLQELFKQGSSTLLYFVLLLCVLGFCLHFIRQRQLRQVRA